MKKITMDQWRALIEREAVGKDLRDDGWRSQVELAVDLGYSINNAARRLKKLAYLGELETCMAYDPQTKRTARFFRPKQNAKSDA